jgi:hypothetical protein
MTEKDRFVMIMSAIIANSVVTLPPEEVVRCSSEYFSAAEKYFSQHGYLFTDNNINNVLEAYSGFDE